MMKGGCIKKVLNRQLGALAKPKKSTQFLTRRVAHEIWHHSSTGTSIVVYVVLALIGTDGAAWCAAALALGQVIYWLHHFRKDWSTHKVEAFKQLAKERNQELSRCADNLAFDTNWNNTKIIDELVRRKRGCEKDIYQSAEMGREEIKILCLLDDIGLGVLEQGGHLLQLAQRRRSITSRENQTQSLREERLAAVERAEEDVRAELEEAHRTIVEMSDSLDELVDPFATLPSRASRKLRKSLTAAKNELEVARQIRSVLGKSSDL